MQDTMREKPCGCGQADGQIQIFDGGMEKILITGGNGYLGKKLFDRLDGGEIRKGRFVRPLSRSWTGKDILKYEDVDEEMAKVAGGYVYHLACKVSFNKRDEKEVLETAILGTRHVLRAACKYKIKKIVVVSSAITVGACNNPYSSKTEDSTEKDVSNPYVNAKIAQEQLARDAGAVIVAPTTCKLPLMAGMVIPSGGTNVVDPDDVVEGMIYAMKDGRKGEKYILGGYNITFRELYEMAGRKYIVAPSWLRRPLMWAAQFDPSWYMSPYTVDQSFRFKYYNCQKARKELGWEPIVSLRSMLKLPL